MNVMTKAERIANAVSEVVPMTFDGWNKARQAIILELGEIKKEESKEAATSMDPIQKTTQGDYITKAEEM